MCVCVCVCRPVLSTKGRGRVGRAIFAMSEIDVRPLGSSKARAWVEQHMRPEQKTGVYALIEDRFPNMSHGMRCDVVEALVCFVSGCLFMCRCMFVWTSACVRVYIPYSDICCNLPYIIVCLSFFRCLF